MSKPPIEAIVELAGGQSALAERLRVTKAAVNQWVTRGTIPPERCPKIEEVFGIKCEELCPTREWQRDRRGRVTGYLVRVEQAA